jgi:glycosyltransferase involved in cell wall biosynthesis
LRLTIDLRMARHSGIGRYLRNLVPLLLPTLDVPRIRILAPRALLEDAPRALLDDAPWTSDPRLEFFETSAPIYSPAEQALAFGPAFRHTTLLWVPHYNVPLFYRGPLAVTMHDVAPLALPELLDNPLKRAYARRLIHRAVHHAQAVLCVSSFTQSELLRRLHVPLEKTFVTPPGLDLAFPASAPPHAEPDAAPYLLFVGNVKPNKNLALLLEAFAAVADRIPYRLILAGRMEGFRTPDQRVLDRARSLAPRVHLAGEVSEPALHSLYAGATALVLPSLYEGFGLPILEAMHFGCPVLASTAGSLPEVGGDAALYFDPHAPSELSALLLRLSDPNLRPTLHARAQLRIAHFSFQHCAAETSTVLNRLLRQPA